MKLRYFLFVPAIAATALLGACGSADTKSATPNLGSGMAVDQANSQLAKIPVVGFPAFSASMPMSKFDQYGENAATVAKGVVGMLPAGYKIQLTGHANANSGRSAGYVQSISTQRANFVKNYLVKKGIDGSKLVTVGAGDSQQDPSLSKEDNRRVTFSVVEAK